MKGKGSFLNRRFVSQTESLKTSYIVAEGFANCGKPVTDMGFLKETVFTCSDMLFDE